MGTAPAQLDYLVLGHVTWDRIDGGRVRTGGTAAYAARTAQALGCRVGVVTSGGEGLELSDALPNVRVWQVPAPSTTTFDNRYTPEGRVQVLEATAAPLTPEEVPPGWRRAGVVHLGPVAQECDPRLASHFPDSFLGVTPQGWMRRWDEEGRVRPVAWNPSDTLLRRADAIVLSGEDVAGDEEAVARWASRTRILVVTRGAAGCTVYADGIPFSLPGLPVVEVDPTGAGDVFAATLFVALERGIPLPAAAGWANCVAAVSVTRRGLSGAPTPEEAARCRTLWT